MNRKPEKSIKNGLFADGLWAKILIEGTMIGMLTFLSFTIGCKVYGLEVGRTMAFITLSMLELVHSFNIKTEDSIFKTGIKNNPFLIGAFILGAILQISVVSIKNLALIFNCIPLIYTQWLIVVIISICPIIIIEFQKKINDFKFGKRIYSFAK